MDGRYSAKAPGWSFEHGAVRAHSAAGRLSKIATETLVNEGVFMYDKFFLKIFKFDYCIYQPLDYNRPCQLKEVDT